MMMKVEAAFSAVVGIEVDAVTMRIIHGNNIITEISNPTRRKTPILQQVYVIASVIVTVAVCMIGIFC